MQPAAIPHFSLPGHALLGIGKKAQKPKWYGNIDRLGAASMQDP